MAQTGINIKVADTVLGSPPSVNANTMFIFPITESELGSNARFNSPIEIHSSEDFDKLDLALGSQSTKYQNYIDAFFRPVSGIDNTGSLAWVVFIDSDSIDQWYGSVSDVVSLVLETTTTGFNKRPRTIVFELNSDVLPNEDNAGPPQPSEAQDFINRVQEQLMSVGIATVCILGLANNGTWVTYSDFITALDPSQDGKIAPFVATVVAVPANSTRLSAASYVAGIMAGTSVGVSIGDTTLNPMTEELHIYADDELKTRCDELSADAIRAFGSAQLIFARTRPPRNGLWWNDGSTLNDPQNALSTLEAARTLCSVVDDLRLFFTNYINTRVPVAANGDIDPTYKQVVLDNARAKVITPYIESGDISDARIELVAKNNNMVSTRTWEVKVSILPAPTLRWIDGFVFYVNSL